MKWALAALILALVGGCHAVPHMVLYNQTGESVIVYVREMEMDRRIKAGPRRAVVLRSGKRKSFHDYQIEPALIVKQDGCTYRYRIPDDPQGYYNTTLAQLEPDFSIHILSLQQERVELGRFRNELRPGFPLKPISKVCE